MSAQLDTAWSQPRCCPSQIFLPHPPRPSFQAHAARSPHTSLSPSRIDTRSACADSPDRTLPATVMHARRSTYIVCPRARIRYLPRARSRYTTWAPSSERGLLSVSPCIAYVCLQETQSPEIASREIESRMHRTRYRQGLRRHRPSPVSPHLLNRRGAQSAVLRSVRPAPDPTRRAAPLQRRRRRPLLSRCSDAAPLAVAPSGRRRRIAAAPSWRRGRITVLARRRHRRRTAAGCRCTPPPRCGKRRAAARATADPSWRLGTDAMIPARMPRHPTYYS